MEKIPLVLALFEKRKMKFKLGYFYQVRFFQPNMIPLSTAHSDPKWYHANHSAQFTYFDKNNVINGLRCDELAPGSVCAGLCNGSREKGCNPTNCEFLRAYRLQLETTFDIPAFLKRCEVVAQKTQEMNSYTDEPVIVLMVHEAPDNPCSERKTLINFFNAHGIDIEELRFPL